MRRHRSAAIKSIGARYGAMLVPAADQVVCYSLCKYGEWAEHEIQSISNHINDGGVIIDVGANVGAQSLAYAARFPNSRIISFEPQPLLYDLLVANTINNNYSNIEPQHAACSNGFDTVFIGPDYENFSHNYGSVGIRSSHAAAISPTPVPVIRIDSIDTEPCVTFVKIDVEGMELEVIQGMAAVVIKDRPLIYFEASTIDAVLCIRNWLKVKHYELFWHETSAYNINNFNSDPENIWTRCEIGVLAVPEARSGSINLPKVTGNETAIPAFHDPKYGFRGDDFRRASPPVIDS